MKEIPLTKGYVALVDDEDYERVSRHKWRAATQQRADGTVRVYAQRAMPRPRNAEYTQMLHRFILNAPAGMEVDHINGDPLDNRRANMRVCTRSENMRNARPQTGKSSKFKGVTWNKQRAKWQVQIKIDGPVKFMGHFTIELEAARAYDCAAIKHFGEFARLNFPHMEASHDRRP